MKTTINIFLIFVLHGTVLCQNNKNTDTLYNLPSLKVPVTDFFVDGLGLAYVPLNGGIYMPQMDKWFIPPSPLNYISSIMMREKDTSFYTIEIEKDSCSINHVSLRGNEPKIFTLSHLPKGVYNFASAKDRIVVWGRSNNKSKIWTYTSQGFKCIMTTDKIITDVEISTKNEVLFSMDSVIVRLSDLKTLANLKSKVFGFASYKNNSIIASTANGIYAQADSTFSLVAIGLKGSLEVFYSNIYVVSNSREKLWEIVIN